MAESRRSITQAQVEAIVKERVSTAIREVTWLMAVVIPELMKSPQWGPEDRAKLAAALEGVAEHQQQDGRLAAATAATALAEALRATQR